jgi:hypothetical protein
MIEKQDALMDAPCNAMANDMNSQPYKQMLHTVLFTVNK